MIQEIALSLLLVKGSFGMSYASQIRTVKVATAVIEFFLPVKFTFKRIRKVKDPYPNTRTLDERGHRLASFEGYLFRKRFYNENAINLIMDAPIIDDGVRYIAGITSRVCRTKGGFVIVQVQDLNQNFIERTLQSVIAVIHELGHALGMKHVESPTYMNYGASGLEPLPVEFDAVNLKQCKRCLRRKQ